MIKARDLTITPCSLNVIRNFIEKHHYSHNINGVKISYCFSVTFNHVLVGGIIYSMMSTTAWKHFGKKERDVLELRRLVLINEAGRNSESRIIGWTLRWLKKYAPEIKTIISYADPAHGHVGTIYKASNFIYDGLSGKDRGFLNPATGKIYHSRALRTTYKGRLKPFAKRLQELHKDGKLREIVLPQKHRYIYKLRNI